MEDDFTTIKGYLGKGWSPIPLVAKEKRPSVPNWQDLRIEWDSVPKYWPNGEGIGILLGEPSGGLVDSDLDCEEAVAVAERFYPDTARFGRPSRPKSHYLLYAPDCPTTQYEDVNGEMIMELRSSGSQTVFPGTEHSGEVVAWEDERDPVSTTAERLLKLAGMTAAGALAVRHWPKPGDKNRQNCALALSGLLVLAEIPYEHKERWLRTVLEIAGDEEVEMRLNTLKGTQRKHDNGATEIVRGPKLAEFIGDKVVRKLTKWLGIHSPELLAEELLIRARALTDDMSIETVKAVTAILREAAEGRLPAAHLYLLRKTLKASTGIPMGELKKMASVTEEAGAVTPSILAKEVLKRYYGGGDYLACDDAEQFYTYTGTHWIPRADQSVLNEVHTVATEIIPIEGRDHTSISASALQWLKNANPAKVNFRRLLHGTNAKVINCKNGELYLDGETGPELRPHSPLSELTYCLDINYDPEATAPLYLRTLHEIFAQRTKDGWDADDFQTKALVYHWLEIQAYIIQDRRPFAAFFLLHGAGANGKTKLVETIQKLLPEDTVATRRITDFETDKFALGDLPGKLALVDDDVDARTKLPDGFLKKISEEKTMTADRKFKGSFTFVCRVVPLLLANNWPQSSDVSSGVKRRIQVIPFSRKFLPDGEDTDATRFERIWESELSGILNLSIEALDRLMTRGRFRAPKISLDAAADFGTFSNPIQGYLDDKNEVVIDPLVVGSLPEIYSRFRIWCEAEGINQIPRRVDVRNALESMGYQTYVGNGNKRFVGGVTVTDMPF
jgi:P4 family phage/plasmid primase-like protien